MSEICWACNNDAAIDRACQSCGAPFWEWDPDACAGVYVVLARESGMVKIGFSHDVPRRFVSLVRASPEWLDLEWILRGAGRKVEAWLHEIFADVRDPGMARAYGLPNTSEWFWPTPGLRRMYADGIFMEGRDTYEMANA